MSTDPAAAGHFLHPRHPLDIGAYYDAEQHRLCYVLPPANPSSAPPSDMLSGHQLENALHFNATKKISNPPDKVFFLAVLAGIWVGIGGITAVTIGGGVPEHVRAEWVALPKFLMGAVFAFALHFIALFGGELFTGNAMILTVGYLNKVHGLRVLLLNWLIVYIGNWAGTLLTGYFIGYLGGLFKTEQYRIFLDQLVQGKLESLTWVEIFMRGIAANTMVCIALVMGIAARGTAGKVLVLWFPVVTFVGCGFEHCIANMIFCSLGLMYGAQSTIGRLWFNQSAALCGNIIGGVLVIGVAVHFMNHWKSPIFNTVTGAGTLAAHDVESSRRAKDVDEQTIAEKDDSSATGAAPDPESRWPNLLSLRKAVTHQGANQRSGTSDKPSGNQNSANSV